MADLELDIVFRTRDRHLKYGERASTPVHTIAGYLEVYEYDGLFYGLRETADGGASRSIGHLTSAEAVADLTETVTNTWDFWQEKIRWRNNGDVTLRDQFSKGGEPVVRVDHHHYVIGEPQPNPGPGHGHSGRLFRFTMRDGSVVESRNVWSQGEIPRELWEQLPDNALAVTWP